MKKRSLLVAFIVSMLVCITACGMAGAKKKENPFVGTWTGTLDMTEYVTNGIVAENAELQEYLRFQELTFSLVFAFTEDSVSLKLDETSAQKFVENVETGIADMIDAVVADMAQGSNMSVEDVYAAMSVTREEYIDFIVASMNLNDMQKIMAEVLELNGAYKYDAEKIVVVYEDDTYEVMRYVKGNEDLTITVSDGTNDFVIHCTKTK